MGTCLEKGVIEGQREVTRWSNGINAKGFDF